MAATNQTPSEMIAAYTELKTEADTIAEAGNLTPELLTKLRALRASMRDLTWRLARHHNLRPDGTLLPTAQV